MHLADRRPVCDNAPMSDLVPYPFGALARRAFRELERRQSVYDLPARSFFRGDPARDLSVPFHGHRPSSALGPAAGPHTQMAQNLVLSWLGGARIFELKTVQILDELEIPRPCIDMRTVGYNAEWSQELKLAESLAEYVKGAMLIEMLRASGLVPLEDGFDSVVFDMSVGYDLAGIRSDGVQAFVRGMRDATVAVDALRREIPSELKQWRDLPFPTRLSDSVTLSTFHGCPPDEIERIMTFLMRDLGLNAIVKLNPTLLGLQDARHLLHDVLGYADLRIPDAAFERDTTWAQAVDFVGRLREVAASAGVGFGVKLSNTLIVENTAGFLPASEKEVYLSGAPLHVLAIELVRRFRRTFGGELPLSFSAGIDRTNFPDAVALGLVPVTVCTDLLKKGGYRRLAPYHAELARRMDAVGATDVATFIHRAYGPGPDGESGAAARVRNAEHYADRAPHDSRYADPQNRKGPKKIGSRLSLFDCVTCDLCIPACPNAANFTFTPPGAELPVVRVRRDAAGRLVRRREGSVPFLQRHQIGVFADFCNACGNCDVFCPEDGGPYVAKPRFHGTVAAFRRDPFDQGFHISRRGGGDVVLGRFAGEEWALEVTGSHWACRGPGFRVEFDAAAPDGPCEGDAPDGTDLSPVYRMDALRRGVLEGDGTLWPAGISGGREDEDEREG